MGYLYGLADHLAVREGRPPPPTTASYIKFEGPEKQKEVGGRTLSTGMASTPQFTDHPVFPGFPFSPGLGGSRGRGGSVRPLSGGPRGPASESGAGITPGPYGTAVGKAPAQPPSGRGGAEGGAQLGGGGWLRQRKGGSTGGFTQLRKNLWAGDAPPAIW